MDGQKRHCAALADLPRSSFYSFANIVELQVDKYFFPERSQLRNDFHSAARVQFHADLVEIYTVADVGDQPQGLRRTIYVQCNDEWIQGSTSIGLVPRFVTRPIT